MAERERLPRPRLPREERVRRLRETLSILAAGLAVVVFAVWEIGRPTEQDTTGNVFSFLIVNLNIILLLVMAFLVLRNVMKLVIDRRRRVPGSRLRGRLVMAFVSIALFPATVMLAFSYQFVSGSIDDWLGDEVEAALQGAYDLAHTYYSHTAENALIHARAIAGEIAARGLLERFDPDRLDRLVAERQQAYSLGTVQILDRRGEQVLSRTNPDRPTGTPVFADPDLLAKANAGQEATKVERVGEGDIIRGSAPVLAPDGIRTLGSVVVDYYVSESARRASETILEAFREFRQLRLNKRPFKNLYGITLALAAFVVLLSATWLGIYLARGITDPIGRLAGATRRVAEGDLAVRLEEEGGDEVGMLVRAFNSMTSDLAGSREALEERRAYIENVLAHIDAGVISVDPAGVIGTVNPAAISLLGLSEKGLVGRDAAEMLLDAGYLEIAALLRELRAATVASGTRINVTRRRAGRTLQVSGSRLVRGDGAEAGFVLFVENVSQIVEVQRMEAWREVARRIAHEIKNPLTPIQLSAQRLGRRLRKRLDGEDAEVLDECVDTIVGEVDTLKTLVNEFANFARRSGGAKSTHDLGEVVEETLPMYRQSRPDIRLELALADGVPPVRIHRDSVKRVLINLLDNAISAVSGAGVAEPTIRISTSWDEQTDRVLLEVADNGPGVPEEHRSRIFEPYYSTKSDGTGLGLAIVASVAAEHQAYVRLHTAEAGGSRFVIEFPPARGESAPAYAAPDVVAVAAERAAAARTAERDEASADGDDDDDDNDEVPES